MKKFFVTATVLIVFILYTVFYHKSSAQDPIITDRSVSPASSSSSAEPTSSSGGLIQTPKQSATAFKDGTYMGSAADAFYGTIQVQTVIRSGKIADVQFVQYPHDQKESIQVNQSAMPTLKQEAIQAQSARVDIVSGATQTSQAFQQSLASALAQSK